MSPPPRQSGRFDASAARGSSPRLAAQYNLEHDPLQSENPEKESGGMAFLRGLSAGSEGTSRWLAGVLALLLLGGIAYLFFQTATSMFSGLGEFERNDPGERIEPLLAPNSEPQGEEAVPAPRPADPESADPPAPKLRPNESE